jgi:DNA-binding winged helix-turn-helix (wHTH) protein
MTGKNVDKYEYFYPTNLDELISVTKKYFDNPEIGVVISAPFSGMAQRVDQIIQDHSAEYSGKMIKLEFGLHCDDVDSFESIIRIESANAESGRINLFLINADYLIKSDNQILLNHLIHMHKRQKKIRFILFFEINIFALRSYNTNIYTHVYFYPLLDKLDSQRFISYLCDKWQMNKIPKRLVSQIIRQCGGHMLLLKHAVRMYKNEGEMPYKIFIAAHGTRYRLELILSKLTKNETLALITKNTDSDSLYYLNEVNLMNKKICTVPLLNDFIKDTYKTESLVLKGGNVYLGSINLKYTFTKQEYTTLRLLLQKRVVVTRDEIANILWGEECEEKFSVWAIEQVIMRIRKKLDDIGSDSKLIKTVRNIGYKIQQL